MPTIAEIFAAYDNATRASDVDSIESTGTISGEGLAGDFHSWRSGDNEREDERLGPRSETTLRLGTRLWASNANGNVRELRGFLRRRAITGDFVDSGAFLKAPDHARFVGFGDVNGSSTWRVEVNADGGEPETLWIDRKNGLPLRLEYLDGDGPTFVDFSDWRDVQGRKIAFRTVTTDGDHEFDTVETTTSVHVERPIDPAVFRPLVARTLQADGVQTVPLLERGNHIACTVSIDGKPYTFLIDSGAQNVLLDSHVAKETGMREEGALEVRGAGRSGGLHVGRLPRLDIGTAHLDDLVVSSYDLGPSLSGMRVDGILGYPFFASSVVELDFANHVMRFGPPGSFVPHGEKIALDVDRELPEATFGMNDRLTAPFIVDTGNSGEMLLYHPFIIKHPGLVPFTGSGSLNYGVGGTNRTYHTQLDELLLGSTPLYRRSVDVVLADTGAFADRVDAGNVGLGVLRNFTATFDLGNAAMYLDRAPNFDDGRTRPGIVTLRARKTATTS